MERLRLLARRFALDILIVILAVGSAVEVALWHHDEYQSHPAWVAVPEIALVVVLLLGRRRFPFYAPAAMWLLAAAVSFTDGWLVVTPVSTFLAANVAAFLLGNVSDGLQARLGLALVLCGAVIVVDNKPDHDGSELVFVPVMFAIAWAAGYALRERARHAEVAEQRAVHAEHERRPPRAPRRPTSEAGSRESCTTPSPMRSASWSCRSARCATSCQTRTRSTRTFCGMSSRQAVPH